MKIQLPAGHILPNRAYLMPEFMAKAEKTERIEKAKSSLLDFELYTNKEYRPNWHHELISDVLTKFVHGKIKRLLIQEPPAYGKSQQVSRDLPPFIFQLKPNARILGCSYGDDLSVDMNKDIRKIMDSEEYQSLTDVRLGATRNDNKLEITSSIPRVRYNGLYRNAGVGGAITGKHFNYLLIDDYFKNYEEAESPTYREKIWNWYATTFYSRKLPDAGICITATQWNLDDLIGRLKKLEQRDPNADKWTVISLPVYADYPDGNKPDYDKRKPHELLWKERFDEDSVLATKATMTSYQFSALYMQRPISHEGNAIKREWYEPYIYAVDFSEVTDVCLSYDIGFSDSADADWTWGSLKAKMKDGSLITLWQHFGKWDNKTRREHIAQIGIQTKAMMEKCFPNVKWYLTEEAGVGAGVAVINEDIKYLIGKGLPAYPSEIKKQAKAVRAITYRGSCENHMTKFYAGGQFKDYGFVDGIKEWINPFLEAATQLHFSDDGLKFKGGKDDMIDAEVIAHEGLVSIVGDFGMPL